MYSHSLSSSLGVMSPSIPLLMHAHVWRCVEHAQQVSRLWVSHVYIETTLSYLMLNGAIIQVMISTHNKYDDHTQMMSNVHECRVRCGG